MEKPQPKLTEGDRRKHECDHPGCMSTVQVLQRVSHDGSGEPVFTLWKCEIGHTYGDASRV